MCVLYATAMHANVESVALGTSVAYVLALLGMTACVERHFQSVFGVMDFLMELSLAAAVLLASLAAADGWIRGVSSLGPDTGRVLLRCAALLIPGSSMFWWSDRTLKLRQFLVWRPREP